MRFRQFFLHTLKEAPSEAEVVSHQLMIRAGMIRRLAAGIYTYLPFGLRSIRKFEQIVREEMMASGAQELLMPAIQPAEIWQESGRWQVYGKELLRIKDRHERDFCFGPTHEEVITTLCRNEIRSYRDLPVNLFQIQTKFRDEVRPRFGLMRGREFIMKDAYSFDRDFESAQKSYEVMFETYQKIFSRCGLDFRVVEALTGNIGGSLSHEFQVLAQSGEDTILFSENGKYAANIEKAEITVSLEDFAEKAVSENYQQIETPNQKTIEEVTKFLKKRPDQLIKTIIYSTEKGFIAACVRGDHEVNEHKLKVLSGENELNLATDEETEKATNAPVGFAGPVCFKGKIFVDQAISPQTPYVTGANQLDAHFENVYLGVHFKPEKRGDLRMAKAGDAAPDGSGPLHKAQGIEVGQVFYLGTKYSEALHAVFLDDQGKEKPLEMGCYGIGIGRTIAACIEQNHDEQGIVFPMTLAPFHVLLISLAGKDQQVKDCCEQLYRSFLEAGIEVLYDDRDERAGVKFNDADLLGIPIQVILGKKSVKDKLAEVKERKTGEVTKISLSEVCPDVQNRIKTALQFEPQ